MKIREKLQKRLFDDLGIKVHAPERIQRGTWGKLSGQWAWFARYADGYAGEIGSEDTMTDCVNARSISLHECLSPRGQIVVHADSDPESLYER